MSSSTEDDARALAASDAEIISRASADRTPIIRTFDAEFQEAGDGRTVDLRIVPFNTIATVSDAPSFEPYEEMWVPGAFNKQLQAANRVAVFLNFEHGQSLRDVVGHGTELRDGGDALYGSFKIHDNPDGEKALQLIREDVLTGVSLEAVPQRSVIRNGVVNRVRAHLDKVALARAGRAAYQDAQVLAVRTGFFAGEPDLAISPTLAARAAHFVPVPEAVEEMVMRQVIDAPWNGSPSRFTPEQWRRSCILHLAPTLNKSDHKLPIREPDGQLNRNALGAAAAALAGGRGGVDAPPAQKKIAARTLMAAYREAKMDAPASTEALAA